MLQAVAVCVSGKRQHIKPYPRPNANKEARKLGNVPMSKEALETWFKKKRGE